jgi:hypothetical protein
MAQDEDLDLVGGVGASVEHHPAQELREHLVDQLHRHRRIMPRHRRPRITRSAAEREVSGTHRMVQVVGPHQSDTDPRVRDPMVEQFPVPLRAWAAWTLCLVSTRQIDSTR